jgi:tRNA(adenine34) deaminase
MIDNSFMDKAIVLAKKAYKLGEVPVGAVVVNRVTNEIISACHNLVESKHNPLLHAEILAINAACKTLKSKNLSDCDLYVSLEPCVMCAAAISYARIGRLFYACNDVKQGAVENNTRFFTTSSCFHRPEIYNNLSGEFSARLIKSFFRKIRKNGL